MESYQKYFKPETLAQLEGLELQARQIVEGFVAGLHQSPYHGFSIEFAEHREYAPGDDLRYVDWKVFAKTDRFYLKQYEEETNFSCHVLLDTSESMLYQSETAAVTKLHYAQFVAAALSYLVLRQQDAVGLATYDNGIRNFVRASSQPSHLKQLCHTMEESPAQGESAMGIIFDDLAERIKKRGLILIISDLFDNVDEILMGLKHFRHKRHEVVVMQVIDPAEQDFPFRDPTLFKGLENWPEMMTDPRSLKAAYQTEFESFLMAIRRGCRDMRMDHILLRTDTPLDIALSAFLASRAGRMRK